MASAQHAAGDATCLYGKSGQEAAELLFSSEARPAIRLEKTVSFGPEGRDTARTFAPFMVALPNFSDGTFAPGG